MVNKLEPYVGPRPFSQGEDSRFFGREREANELLSLIIAHPVVLLYAQSGAGKTSLLNARVVPILKERNSQVFGPARVGGALPQWIKYKDVKNVYSFNALLSIKGELIDSPGVWGKSFADFMEEQAAIAQDRPYSRRVVIFDQFEEIFTTHPERWKDRDVFLDSIGIALERDPRLRVIFAIREEYIAHMDPLAPSLPERLRTRFRLERLREDAALLAVTMPLEGTGYNFAQGAAEKLVGNLLQVSVKADAGTVEVLGEFVEPVQLQVVCKKLWQSLPSGVRLIDESYIKNYGDANNALASYYDECVKQAAKKSHVKEGVLRRWFGQKLITPDRTRGTVYKDTYADSGLTSSAIAELENLHLIRAEMRGGVPWYELTHDRFITPIIKSNEEWFSKEEKSIGQRLEERAKDWSYDPQNQRTSYLLEEGELQAALQWLNSSDAEDLGVSGTLTQFIQASQANVTKKLRRQRTVLLTALAATVAACAMIIWAVYTLKNVQARNERTSRDLGNTAKYLSDIPPNEFMSLVYGLDAFDAVNGRNPPPEAVEGLRAAITAFGNSTWLRGLTFPTRVIEAKFSPTGEYAVAYSKSEACVWATDTGEQLFKTSQGEGKGDYVSVTLTGDGKRLVTVTAPRVSQDKNKETSQGDNQLDYKTEVWDVANKKREQLWTYATARKSLVLNDYRYVLVFAQHDKPFVIDAESIGGSAPRDKYSIDLEPQEAKNIESAVISTEQMHLIVAGAEGDLNVWDLTTGKVVKSLLPKEKKDYYHFRALHLSAQEKRLVLVGRYWQATKWVNRLYIRDLDGYQPVGRPISFPSDDYFRSSYLSRDGKKLIILTEGDDDYLKVSIWDVASGNQEFINREAVIKGNADSWHNEVGLFEFNFDNKQLMFEDYDTGQATILLNLVPKYAVITHTDISPKGLLLAVIDNSTINIRERGSEMLNVDNYSPEQLKSKACEFLRDQPEFNSVETICNP